MQWSSMHLAMAVAIVAEKMIETYFFEKQNQDQVMCACARRLPLIQPTKSMIQMEPDAFHKRVIYETALRDNNIDNQKPSLKNQIANSCAISQNQSLISL